MTHTCFFCFAFLFPISDVHQPLSQIRMSLAGSLGSGQIILLSGIEATENMVRSPSQVGRVMAKMREYVNTLKWPLVARYWLLLIINELRYFAGCLRSSSRSSAVLSDGSFLLDVRWGNLPLFACCKSLQHRKQDAHLSRVVLGYVLEHLLASLSVLI